MPSDYLSFIPIVGEDANSVRRRVNADMTVGLSPTDPLYPDLIEGGWYWDVTQPFVLEAARLWDFLATEVPAAEFPATAWGDYLDLHGETVNLPREGAVQATGEVVFTGDIGTLIPANAEVATLQPDPSAPDDPVTFTTDRTITLVDPAGPTGLSGAGSGTGGVLPAATYYYVVTAIGANGETIASNEIAVTVAGTTSSVVLSWTAVGGATAYKVYRGTVPGQEQLLGQIASTGKTAPTGVTATPHSTGGTLAASTRYYKVTALGQSGETLASAEVSAVVPAGGTGSVSLTWQPVFGAASYRVYWGTATNAEGHYLAAATTSLTDTGTTGTAASPPGSNTTTGTSITDVGAFAPGAAFAPTNSVPITAVQPGSAGNVGAGTIVVLLSPVVGAPQPTNPVATSGGADLESDARYQLRVLAEFGRAGGAGNIADYIKWSLTIPQVGNVTVQPIWAGAGTVRVIVTDQFNNPVSQSILTALQTLLDPQAGNGAGLAPVGALVTVATPTLHNVTVAATIAFLAGYSLDGVSGSIASRAAIQDAVLAYVGTLAPGEHVVYNSVIRQIMLVPGVDDVTALTLNGSAANVTVAALEVAALVLPVTLS